MRPQLLFSCFAEVTALPGVGPRLAGLIRKLAGPRIVDLLWLLPREIIDRRYRPTIIAAEPNRVATLRVHVTLHQPPLSARHPYRIACRDETGALTLIFFRGDRKYLEQALPQDSVRIVSGRQELYNGAAQMAHPDFILPEDRLSDLPDVEPVYPLTAGLTPRLLRKAVQAAVGRVRPLPEWLDPALMRRMNWPAWDVALRAAHKPESETALRPEAPPRARLAYDELLANQLALSLTRARARRRAGRPRQGDGSLRARVLAALPYRLTEWQEQALGEILADMAAPARMLRLLQGDVGSGKTIVALLAMLNAVESGGQAALMAPTEILARQHAAVIAALAGPAGVPVVTLTGRDKGVERQALLADIASGAARLVIGTHALFQDDIVFHDLALAVVDEQHRFGVRQRLALAGKSRDADLLVMTATPIPRTLMMSAYGDLDVSRLAGKPPGRLPVRTLVVDVGRLEEVLEGVGREVARGARVYWICPLVEESDVLDFTAAMERHAALARRFGEDRAALLHGRMKPAEKDAVMARFASGDAAILVATTVVEVGMDVPEATLMLVEQAERFGLAQLHQLRGRIGRGDQPSTCILLRSSFLGETARARLETLRATDDGFEIAEKDLALRGAGEVLGTRQSGLPEFRLADLAAHGDLMQMACADTAWIMENDPGLTGPRGPALRLLLYLFERDAAVETLQAG